MPLLFPVALFVRNDSSSAHRAVRARPAATSHIYSVATPAPRHCMQSKYSRVVWIVPNYISTKCTLSFAAFRAMATIQCGTLTVTHHRRDRTVTKRSKTFLRPEKLSSISQTQAILDYRAYRVPELIPVLGSQPAGDVSHKPGGRLPLLSARPAVTPATLKRAATNFAAWRTETQRV